MEGITNKIDARVEETIGVVIGDPGVHGDQRGPLDPGQEKPEPVGCHQLNLKRI